MFQRFNDNSCRILYHFSKWIETKWSYLNDALQNAVKTQLLQVANFQLP